MLRVGRYCAKIASGKKIRMATELQIIVENNQNALALINSMKSELSAIQRELVGREKRKLEQENAELAAEVQATLDQLIKLELLSGKKQIPVPGARGLCTNVPAPISETPPPAKPETKSTKEPKEKKVKEKKPVAGDKVEAAVEAPIDVGRLDMRVGRIIEVDRHPDADSLYLEKIDCGEANPRTVVSGLVKFIPLEEMKNRMVIVLCNLKPAKMRGVLSEAMVMCASTPDKVEVLSPPTGAVPGDLVHCESYTRQPDAQLNPKKKIFETCAPDLMTNGDLIACYKGSALHVPGKGNIVAQTLKNVNVK